VNLSTKETTKVSLLDILENTPETIEVPDIGKVSVKCPTAKDKLEAKREALKIAAGLSEEDILMEQTRILAIKMIVDPVISLDDYLKSNDNKVTAILDSVHMWYNLKLKALNAKRQEQIRSFLEQMKET
jgi:hypothetical protein